MPEHQCTFIIPCPTQICMEASREAIEMGGIDFQQSSICQDWNSGDFFAMYDPRRMPDTSEIATTDIYGNVVRNYLFREPGHLRDNYFATSTTSWTTFENISRLSSPLWGTAFRLDSPVLISTAGLFSVFFLMLCWILRH